MDTLTPPSSSVRCSEWAKTNETRTANREYYVVFCWGKWHPHFRPINAKTGKPWQASRGIAPYICETEAEAVAAIAAEKERSGK